MNNIEQILRVEQINIRLRTLMNIIISAKALECVMLDRLSQ